MTMSTLRASGGALWTITHSALYGYHISSLNGVQEAVICADRSSRVGKLGLRGCLDLNDSTFGIAVTVLTLGGLLGSLLGDPATRRLGRTGVLRLSECLFAGGAALVGVANGLIPMVLGRVLIGLASGLVLVTVPLHLSEIAPKRFSRLFGTLHQISIGLGMIMAQSLSLVFAKPFVWRYILLIGGGVALVLLLSSYLVAQPQKSDDGVPEEERRLLSPAIPSEHTAESLSVRQLLTSDDPVKRKALWVVVAAQFGQQVCGISPVMYFSTKILTPVFHGDSKLVALFVMAIGIPFNFAPGVLPEAFSTKRLLLGSSALTALFSILLAMGLNMNNQLLSGISVVAFVISFSLGLAPMAWVVLPEVMPQEGRTAASSIAVSVNWMTNFAAGSSFLPLQQWLKHGDKGEGDIFYVFAGASIVALLAIGRAFKVYESLPQQD